MSLVFTELTHTYDLDGERVPSVTQILQRSGLIDFSSVPEPILLAARDRGAAVHRATHYWLDRDLDVEGFRQDFPEYSGYLDSLIAFFATANLQTIACECRIASRRHRFAGTLDWIGDFNGTGAILDWATGAPADVAKDLQTAAYEGAAREWISDDPVLHEFFRTHPCVSRAAIRLKKDGSLPSVEPYADPRDYAEFLTLLRAQEILAKHRMARREVA